LALLLHPPIIFFILMTKRLMLAFEGCWEVREVMPTMGKIGICRKANMGRNNHG
jgi:hypothetical protein